MIDEDIEATERILVVKLSSLGDLFHALPAVHAIKEKLGVAVDWVTQPEYVDLVHCFTDVERVYAYPRRRFWRQALRFRRELREAHYRHVLDFQGLFKSGLVARMARSGSVIGPSWQREGSRLFYHGLAGPGGGARHAVDAGLDFAEYFGAGRPAAVFPVAFPAAALLGPRPWIALAPVSRWPSKNWPVARYAELAQRLTERHGGTVVAVGGAADREACGRVVAALGAQGRNLAGELSLPRLGGLLSDVDLLIANDSGPVHMAVAVGSPCLVLFGPTDADLTGPYGNGHAVLRAPEPCQPCGDRTCPGVRSRGVARCMDRIDVEDVLMAAVAMLRRQ